MPNEYEINELAKEESWRMFRIMGELVEALIPSAASSRP